MGLRWIIALAPIACGPAAEALDGDPVPLEEPMLERPAVSVPIDAPANFSFVLGRSLAGLAKPGIRHPLREDLAFLQQQEFVLLISLTETPIDPNLVRDHGMTPLHIPIRDFTAPTMDQLHLFVAETDSRIRAGEAVAVHCLGGLGRTGTMLAGYFVAHGMPPLDAIAKIRELRPGSIETRTQEQAILEFSKLQ